VSDPSGVATVTRPEPPAPCVAVRLDALALDTSAALSPTVTRSLVMVGSNPDPVIISSSPAAVTVGDTDKTLGPWPGTSNGLSLVADPADVVTVIGPVVAPLGTETSSSVAEAATTVASMPLNDT
jgi:hypothetical protein